MILEEERKRWLEAAYIYYLSPGDDTGMSDGTWDMLGAVLYINKDRFPTCPILNAPDYTGGSLYWVKRDVFIEALKDNEPTTNA